MNEEIDHVSRGIDFGGIGTGMGMIQICTLGAAVLLTMNSAAYAQGTWSSDAPPNRSEASRRQNSGAFDEGSIRGNNEFVGPYAQFGVAVGAIDFDGPIDTDASGGISITGGYRFLPWLSGEANVTYLGGGDAEFRNTDIGDAEFFAFTFGPKVYPLGALDEAPIPEFLQPYALIGIGGGEFEIDGSRGTGTERSSFIARFIFGMDAWITDHIGAYIEGGYHVAADDDVDGAGVFTFGGQYRF